MPRRAGEFQKWLLAVEIGCMSTVVLSFDEMDCYSWTLFLWERWYAQIDVSVPL